MFSTHHIAIMSLATTTTTTLRVPYSLNIPFAFEHNVGARRHWQEGGLPY